MRHYDIEHVIGWSAMIAGAAVAVASAVGWIDEPEKAVILVLVGANFVQHSNRYKGAGGRRPGSPRGDG